MGMTPYLVSLLGPPMCVCDNQPVAGSQRSVRWPVCSRNPVIRPDDLQSRFLPA